MVVNFDNATKLMTFGRCHKWVGAVTYGDALVGNRTAHSFMPEFELRLGKERKSVLEYSQQLSNFFQERWNEATIPVDGPTIQGMSFIVGGYDENKPYGSVFLFNVPQSPEPEPKNPESFGMTWGGQLEIASRIIHGYDPRLLLSLGEHLQLSESQIRELEKKFKPRLEYTIPYEVLPLQDCVDLATFLIQNYHNWLRISLLVCVALAAPLR